MRDVGGKEKANPDSVLKSQLCHPFPFSLSLSILQGAGKPVHFSPQDNLPAMHTLVLHFAERFEESEILFPSVRDKSFARHFDRLEETTPPPEYQAKCAMSSLLSTTLTKG